MKKQPYIKIQNKKGSMFCGKGYPTRVIASTGITYKEDKPEIELHKANIAISAGADIITDHSIAGDISSMHKMLCNDLDIPISTLTVYETVARTFARGKDTYEDKEALDIFEEQVERGLSLITVHSTVSIEDLPLLNSSNRLIPSTSRGGCMIIENILKSKRENVYLKEFEFILKVAKKHNITLSLGTTYRYGSICDCKNKDTLYDIELKRMSKLVAKAIENEVPIMIEGIGHAPLQKIPSLIHDAKKVCFESPYRVLTVATDSALGYDHIASAIASSVAALNGADLINAVTRSEHVGHPTLNDVEEAVIAAKIAAHCADIVKNNDYYIDQKMSIARSQVGCSGLINAAIYPEGAKRAIERNKKSTGEIGCSMCGPYCALQSIKEGLERRPKDDKKNII